MADENKAVVAASYAQTRHALKRSADQLERAALAGDDAAVLRTFENIIAIDEYASTVGFNDEFREVAEARKRLQRPTADIDRLGVTGAHAILLKHSRYGAQSPYSIARLRDMRTAAGQEARGMSPVNAAIVARGFTPDGTPMERTAAQVVANLGERFPDAPIGAADRAVDRVNTLATALQGLAGGGESGVADDPYATAHLAGRLAEATDLSSAIFFDPSVTVGIVSRAARGAVEAADVASRRNPGSLNAVKTPMSGLQYGGSFAVALFNATKPFGGPTKEIRDVVAGVSGIKLDYEQPPELLAKGLADAAPALLSATSETSLAGLQNTDLGQTTRNTLMYSALRKQGIIKEDAAFEAKRQELFNENAAALQRVDNALVAATTGVEGGGAETVSALYGAAGAAGNRVDVSEALLDKTPGVTPDNRAKAKGHYQKMADVPAKVLAEYSALNNIAQASIEDAGATIRKQLGAGGRPPEMIAESDKAYEDAAKIEAARGVPGSPAAAVEKALPEGMSKERRGREASRRLTRMENIFLHHFAPTPSELGSPQARGLENLGVWATKLKAKYITGEDPATALMDLKPNIGSSELELNRLWTFKDADNVARGVHTYEGTLRSSLKRGAQYGIVDIDERGVPHMTAGAETIQQAMERAGSGDQVVTVGSGANAARIDMSEPDARFHLAAVARRGADETPMQAYNRSQGLLTQGRGAYEAQLSLERLTGMRAGDLSGVVARASADTGNSLGAMVYHGNEALRNLHKLDPDAAPAVVSQIGAGSAARMAASANAQKRFMDVLMEQTKLQNKAAIEFQTFLAKRPIEQQDKILDYAVSLLKVSDDEQVDLSRLPEILDQLRTALGGSATAEPTE